MTGKQWTGKLQKEEAMTYLRRRPVISLGEGQKHLE
jgi:hypothetical protein